MNENRSRLFPRQASISSSDAHVAGSRRGHEGLSRLFLVDVCTLI